MHAQNEFYPNPVKNLLYFTVVEDGEISICSVDGKKVLEQTAFSGDQPIDLSGLSQGVYFLRYSVNNSLFTVKIVKE